MLGKHGSSTVEISDQAIGSKLPAIMGTVTTGTDSSALSTDGFSAPRQRLDDATLAKAVALANSPLPTLPPCDDDHFAKLMRSLAILPRRADDGAKGELRAAVYQRMLGHYPRQALGFMVETALVELEWFPSVKQCLDILGRWERRDDAVRAQREAGNAARAEGRARFRDTMAALECRELDQAAIDAMPQRMREIGAERGFLRLHEDGVYRPRPLREPSDA